MKPRSSDDLEYISCGSIVGSEDGFLKLSTGGKIPASWKEVYLFCAVNKAPAEWHRVFDEDDNLGEERKQKAKYVS